MLALKSYEQTTGFSVLNTDELFFINGGSASNINYDICPLIVYYKEIIIH